MNQSYIDMQNIYLDPRNVYYKKDYQKIQEKFLMILHKNHMKIYKYKIMDKI